MRIKLFCISLLLTPAYLFAFPDSVQYLTNKDTIRLDIEASEKMYAHLVKKGQTLFSIARFYGLHSQDLKGFNPGLKDEIGVGQTIRIPIPNQAIVRYLPKGSSKKEYAPVVYVVKKGDTLFRIGQYFKMPLDTIRMRANLHVQSLKPGMVIPIGWMSIHGIPESYRSQSPTPASKETSSLKARFLAAEKTKKTLSDQGPAYWLKGASPEGNSFYALSNVAPLRSVVEIYNPMSQAKIYAEVLGPIPPTIYEKNIRIVLSSSAAIMLGARDPQFFVKIKYHK